MLCYILLNLFRTAPKDIHDDVILVDLIIIIINIIAIIIIIIISFFFLNTLLNENKHSYDRTSEFDSLTVMHFSGT